MKKGFELSTYLVHFLKKYIVFLGMLVLLQGHYGLLTLKKIQSSIGRKSNLLPVAESLKFKKLSRKKPVGRDIGVLTSTLDTKPHLVSKVGDGMLIEILSRYLVGDQDGT